LENSSLYKVRIDYSQEELKDLYNKLPVDYWIRDYIIKSDYSSIILDNILYNSYMQVIDKYEKMTIGYFRTILFYIEYEDMPLYVVSPNISVAFIAKWRLDNGK